MRTAIIVVAWLWFLVALHAFTEVAVNLLLGLGLFLSAPILTVSWLSYSFMKPEVFSEGRWRWSWLSAPVAWYLPIVLLVTGWGFETRFALSEPYLREFAETVKNGRDETRDGEPRRVGLFRVIAARKGKNEGEVIILTSRGSFDRCGLAYRPDQPPDSSWSQDHLRGPWYLFAEGGS